MPGSTLEAWFKAAKRRWPTIAWPFARFERHVGAEEPRHPEDLFLGGAAADREDPAWNAIHLEVQEDVGPRLARIARGGLAVDELWSETIARLLSEDAHGETLPDGRRQARIRQFRGDSTIVAYLSVVARNIARDLHRRARVITEDAMDLVEDGRVRVAAPAKSDRRANPEEIRALAARFAEAFMALPPKQQALLQLVYGQDMPKGRAGALLSLEDYTVSRMLKAAIEQLRFQLHSDRDGPWTPEAITIWLKAWPGTMNIEEGEKP